MSKSTRHPCINYWFWTEETLKDKRYIKTIDRIASESRFDLITLTDRGCDFWDYSHKPIFSELVEHAHKKGIKIVLQLWTKGSVVETAMTYVDADDAGAVARDVETTVENGRALLRSCDKYARGVDRAPCIKSEFIYAAAFKKTAAGYYNPDTFMDVTDKIDVVYSSPDRVSAYVDLPGCDGYTVFAIAAHYHRIVDVFSDRMVEDFKNIMDYYADVPFDGIALDEFHAIAIMLGFSKDDPLRFRIYGKSFAKVFFEKTGRDLNRTLFEMRYCPEGQDEIRAEAINLYFDVYRRGVLPTENFVADYSKQLFGKDAFLGFHNTFHNSLTCDEIWQTGCAWWELKRDYAQTDENMIFPVRLALACQTKENIHYDMYYHKDAETFFEKAINDAAFGGRIHYHAIDDGGRWGLDTGKSEFLAEVTKYEDQVEILNRFNPEGLPKMSFLMVFGFPALCNWYPNYEMRSIFDINRGFDAMDVSRELWNDGYHNALAPDDTLIDGRITMLSDGTFDYCGHHFDAMLFMYPEYAKQKTLEFLKKAVDSGANLRVKGDLTRGFDGKLLDGGFLDAVKIPDGEKIDPGALFGLKKNDIPFGCRLEDGSVVISHYASLRDGEPFAVNFTLDGKCFDARFAGVFAIKTDGMGKILKMSAGKLYSLSVDGEPVYTYPVGEKVEI